MLGQYRIFAMCIVRNEADIIAECLRAAVEWCDQIFVYDNGSDDGTWEIVRHIAVTHDRVIPFRQDTKPFRDSLRGEIFEHYRREAKTGDWWCRLDADEFYIDHPREFLSKVPEPSGVVWSASFQYYFTEREVARYRSDPHAFDDSVSVHQKCQYYRNDWSEPRFFRHHETLIYGSDDWPVPLAPSYGGRIRLKHFQYRSPAQISKRLATRRMPMTSGMFRHEKVPDWSAWIISGQQAFTAASPSYIPDSWEVRIADSRALIHDDGVGPYVIDERRLPPIRNLK